METPEKKPTNSTPKSPRAPPRAPPNLKWGDTGG